jgi:phosphate starvation-inducible PhoH-like protein
MVRGNKITLRGDLSQQELAKALIAEIQQLLLTGQQPQSTDLGRSARMLKSDAAAKPAEMLSQSILSSRGKSVRPKTIGQKNYVDAIDNHTIVFGIGPAGTGKTYLAMAKAVQALQRKEISRIILTRPAVEAGEKLGFLPGTLNEKIDPYLRPLFDALHDMLDPDSIPKLMATGTIEVAPLAYMRGRTLNDSFVVLDEAQNTTPEQMKMFLTRLGFNSKMIVTGDITQIDLPTGASGLRSAAAILSDVEDMHFAYLSSEDVVRHSLVAKIVDAYSRYEEIQTSKKSQAAANPKPKPVRRSGAPRQ